MRLLEAIRTPADSNSKAWYRNLSLVELIEEIVDKSDRLALEEFHNNRTLFSYNGGAPLLFIDYLNELRESAAKRAWSAPNALEVAEKAYDLTLDKFNNLPNKTQSSLETKSETDRKMKREGPDCRFYFRAFLKRVAWSFETRAHAGHLEEEARAAMIMQGLVRRHFYLSLLEVERKINPFWSRYYWKVKGCKICVKLPISLEGRRRRRWLEMNIEDPDPAQPGERQRIQAIIDQKLTTARLERFKEETYITYDEKSWPDSAEAFCVTLAEVVGEEKSSNIHRQRRSIRALGEERLKELVLRIFEDINCGEYEDRKVAKDFGLAKATFSRFAGSRWLRTESTIPDLWQNTAEVLSAHSSFREVAISTGVWNKVQTTLRRRAPYRGERL